MTIIEAGGLMFFTGILVIWRWYEPTRWRLNLPESLGYILCTVGAVLIVCGTVARIVENWVMRR